MDTKANLSNRKKINELAIQHNKLTTLVACLLNEIGYLKKELNDFKNGDSSQVRSERNNYQQSQQSQQSIQSQQLNPNKFTNFNDLRAEDILKQLSVNNSDN